MPQFLPNFWHCGEEVSEADQLAFLEQQREFMHQKTRPKTKAQSKRRARKPHEGKTIVKERKGAYNLFRGLDHLIWLLWGTGLVSFLRHAPGFENPLQDRPLLVLWYDECGSNLSLYSWLAWHHQMRIVGVRDIYHREWNDTKLCLQASNLWGTVLLMTVVFNMVYGPWSGAGWFCKLQEGMQRPRIGEQRPSKQATECKAMQANIPRMTRIQCRQTQHSLNICTWVYRCSHRAPMPVCQANFYQLPNN